jgi:carbon storage regulator
MFGRPILYEGDLPMLVLRRKIGEEVHIGNGVMVKVLAVNGRSVRLGIVAPATMPIWRSEWLTGMTNKQKEKEPVALAVS